uniref:BTB domain-containing protein n=1 Tax=Panagrellus redivivus TaxID=6233 RepID=A0A7E5A0Y5_PANRE
MRFDFKFLIHRGFMTPISPVFKSAFDPRIDKTKSSIFVINDFSFETVNSAIKYCHSHRYMKKTTAEVVDMLRFYHGFDIGADIVNFPFDFYVQSFNFAVKPGVLVGRKHNSRKLQPNAREFNRDKLQSDCGKFCKQKMWDLVGRPDFNELPPDISAGIIERGNFALLILTKQYCSTFSIRYPFEKNCND